MTNKQFNIIGRVFGTLIIIVALSAVIVCIIGVVTSNFGMVIAGLYIASFGISILVFIGSQIFRYHNKNNYHR